MTFLKIVHAIGAGSLFCIVSITAQAAGKKPLTVADSIQMTVVNDPIGSMLRSNEIGLSPDGKRFFLVTRKGDLKSGLNDYTLWLYEASKVRESLITTELPQPLALTKFSSSSNRLGISGPRWSDDSRVIAFIAEGPNEVPQVYTIDVHTRRLDKLTSHPTPVVDFDLRVGVDTFIYMADTPLDISHRIAHGYEVGTTHMFEVMQGGGLKPHAAFFIGHRAGNNDEAPAGRRVNLQPHNYNSSFGMWLSPKGRYAIVPRLVPGAGLSWWKDYAPVDQPPFNQANDPTIWNFATENPSVFLQYILIDLASGEARPVFDAPTAFLFAGMNLGAHWAEDENSVVLSNTFLPLKGVDDAKELARRRTTPSIVELNLKTGGIQRIVDLMTDPSAPPRPFIGSVMTATGDLIVSWNTKDRTGRKTAYRKNAGRWTEVKAAAAEQQSAPITVTVVQDLNEPPELKVTDLTTGRSKVITDLNPQFRDLEMGHVEVMDWKDVDGRPWQGGLIKPIGYIAGKRYPLVIQTHGFDPKLFLIDGPIGSPSGYAARALANRGMLVLQAQDAAPPYGVPEEPVNQMKGIEAAIEKLDAAGLIDKERLGIHGFSRTGFVVQEALVFSKVKFAAASVADANSRGLLMHLFGFGGGYPAMMDIEWIIGAPLWGEKGRKLWTERDPIFHLDRVHTPLRIESYSGPAWFDAYALLRRQQKPVEYWAFPEAVHNLVKPWQRLTSQGGTVDWYDFWLNGREDPDPSKADQYQKWRKLRVLHEAAPGRQ